jgi:hypothetical protein
VSLTLKKDMSHTTVKGAHRNTMAVQAVPYHRLIRITESDAKDYWPKGYITCLPDPELQGVQPLVRIDDDAANHNTSIVPAHERIRREEIVSQWKIMIGSYLGNLPSGATKGSPGMSNLHSFFINNIINSVNVNLLMKSGDNIVFQSFPLDMHFLSSRGHLTKEREEMFICMAQTRCFIFGHRESSVSMHIGSCKGRSGPADANTVMRASYTLMRGNRYEGPDIHVS